MADKLKLSKFVVICGIDGSGKTSLLKNIANHFPNWYISHWTQLGHVDEQGWSGVFRLGSHPADYIHMLSPMRRALFIATIVWSEFEELIKPRLENGSFVISDSYYYKFLAKEKVYNQTDSVFYKMLDMLPNPDYIIMIDIDPIIACNRKTEFTSYETIGSSLDERINFQSVVRQQLFEIVRPIPHTIINGDQSKNEVFSDVLHVLSNL